MDLLRVAVTSLASLAAMFLLTKLMGNKQVSQMNLFDYVIAVASGQKVKAEEAGFHDMAIFKQGVTL